MSKLYPVSDDDEKKFYGKDKNGNYYEITEEDEDEND